MIVHVHDHYKCLTPFQSLSHKDTATKKSLQKFIFSATLTLPKSFKKKGKEKSVTRGEALGNSLFNISPGINTYNLLTGLHI